MHKCDNNLCGNEAKWEVFSYFAKKGPVFVCNVHVVHYMFFSDITMLVKINVPTT